MKEKVSPAVAGVIVIVVLAVVGVIGFRVVRGGSSAAHGEKPPGMPADAAAEFQKRMGSSNPTSPQGVRGAPSGGPGTGYMAPPMSSPPGMGR